MTNSLSTHTQEPVLIIEPGRSEKNYWTDLWRYRELFLIAAFHHPGLVGQPGTGALDYGAQREIP